MFFRRLFSLLVIYPTHLVFMVLAAIETAICRRSTRRSAFEKVFGRLGLVWVVVFTALATLLRWGTDGLLGDASPFSFYYLSVVLTALVARIGSALVAVILGGLCGHFLWVEPRLSLEFANTSQVAQLAVFNFVATLCAFAVSAARIFRVIDDVDSQSN